MVTEQPTPESAARRAASTTTPMTRLLAGLLVGTAGTAVTVVVGDLLVAPLVGWAAAALAFTTWTWWDVWTMDPADTAAHATREEPTRRVAHLIVLTAAVASLVGVGMLLLASPEGHRAQVVAAVVAVVSVVVSWLAVHTLFGLHYARAYFAEPAGGIDFNQDDPPRYSDFLYVAFTIGMSFAISDTNVRTSELRAAVLRHALLSYLFGSVIIASVVNLVAGL